MKKIVILSMVIGLGLSANAMDYSAPIGGLINDVGGMQNTDAQLKLLEQDYFRKHEYNEFQDMKEVKDARNKKIMLEQDYNNVQREQQYRSNFYHQDVDFVRENGKLMIKRID